MVWGISTCVCMCVCAHLGVYMCTQTPFSSFYFLIVLFFLPLSSLVSQDVSIQCSFHFSRESISSTQEIKAPDVPWVMTLVSSKVNIETLRSLAVGTAPSPHTLYWLTLRKHLFSLQGCPAFWFCSMIWSSTNVLVTLINILGRMLPMAWWLSIGEPSVWLSGPSDSKDHNILLYLELSCLT